MDPSRERCAARRLPHPSCALALGILLSPLLAGCLEAGDPLEASPTGPVVIDGRDPCTGVVGASCRWHDTADAPGWLIEGLRIRGTTGPGATFSEGLRIQNLTQRLVLRDFLVEGLDYGIVVADTACRECELRLEDGTIRGPYTQKQTPGPENYTLVHDPVVGIRVEGSTLGLTLEEVSFLMPGGGNRDGGEGAYVRWGGSIATEVDGGVVDLRLHNVTARAAEYSAQPAFYAVPPENETGGALDVDGLLVEGFDTGMQVLDAAGARVKNATIACESTGLSLFGEGEARFEDVAVAGCTWTALRVAGFRETLLERFRLTDSGTGLRLSGPTESILTILVPVRGIQARATLANGVIADNRYVGMDSGTHLAARNVSFLRNGAEWDTLPNATDTRSGGLSVPWGRAVEVRGSRFEGNVPYALSVDDAGKATLDVDARENWWGDPLGPRVRAASREDTGGLEAPPVGVGAGDAVSREVLFAPFLREPPVGGPRRVGV